VTGTVKTVLIVGGVAVGAYVALRLLAPKPVKQTTASSNGSTISGITSAISGLASFGSALLGSSAKPTGYTSSPGAGNSVGYDTGESFDDYVSGMFGPGIPTYD
jgi:hypothetical protein